MITIFNGRERRLGRGGKSKVYMQVEVSLRQHLREFKGAGLAVFLCIALHSDEDGISSPTVDLICRETGYGEDAVYRALRSLRETCVSGRHVLAARQRRNSRGQQEPNEYLIFPSDEEAELFGAYSYGPDPENPDPVEPYPENQGTATREPTPEKPGTENPGAVASQPTPEKPGTVGPGPAFRGSYSKEKPSLEKPGIEKPATAAETQVQRQTPVVAENAYATGRGDAADLADLVDRLVTARVNRTDASRLARDFPERCEQQLLYLPFHGAKASPGAFLRCAIEGDYAPPPAYYAAIDEEERRRRNAERQEEERRRRAAEEEERTANDRLMERLAADAQDDPEVWAQIQAEAVSRMPAALQGKPNHHAYGPALQSHIRNILLERAGMQEPPARTVAPRRAAAPAPTEEPEPEFDKNSADAALEQLRQRRLAGELILPADLVPAAESAPAERQKGKSARSGRSGVHPQPSGQNGSRITPIREVLK